MATRIELKRGTLGDVFRDDSETPACVVRDLASAPAGWRWLARHLARREARALARLGGLPGFPSLVVCDQRRLIRTWLPGEAMHLGGPPPADYFRNALGLLRRMHALGVAHNDLAKEANWLVGPDGSAGLVDFQLAVVSDRRSRWFRWLAREDLRHLLKHKRHYCPARLSAREQRLLATPLMPARLWRRLVKPVYRLVTRRVLGWPERDGAAERERPRPSPDAGHRD